jgi:hypothetical protein
MQGSRAYRKAALRYWERRRILFNFALMFPAVAGYLPTAAVSGVGDPSPMSEVQVAMMFVRAAVGANVCFTFVYAIEFFFGNDDPESAWIERGRRAVFVLGTLLGMVLAMIGGMPSPLQNSIRQTGNKSPAG